LREFVSAEQVGRALSIWLLFQGGGARGSF
jgi:hypothetical protein